MIGPRPECLVPDPARFDSIQTDAATGSFGEVYRSTTETPRFSNAVTSLPPALTVDAPLEPSWARRGSLPTARQIIESARAAEQAAITLRHRGSACEPLRPTEVSEPVAWLLPYPRLVQTCGLVLTLVLGLGVLGLQTTWTLDRLSLASFEQALHGGPTLPTEADSARAARLAGSQRPWWRTTSREALARVLANHRTAWKNPPLLPRARDDLDQARHIRRGDPAARLNQVLLSQAHGDSPLPDALGLSRDAVSLAALAQILLSAKKHDEAISAVRQALQLALTTPATPGIVPRFKDDPDHPRYLLPGEPETTEILQGVLLDLVAARGTDWVLDALPRSNLVALSAWSLLKPRHPAQAEAVRARWAGRQDAESPAMPSGSTRAHEPRELAAAAELRAAEGQWSLAASFYRHAIAVANHEVLRRSWYWNAADAYGHAADPAQRRSCLESAEGDGPWDDITHRALKAQVPENSSESPQRSRRTTADSTLR